MPKSTVMSGASIGANAVRQVERKGGVDLELSSAQGNVYVGGQLVLQGGIQNEIMQFGAGELASAAALTTANDCPRLTLPDAATTAVFAEFRLPTWWLGDFVIVGLDVVNDAGGAGNVRWETQILAHPFGVAIASPTTVFANAGITLAAPANGTLGSLLPLGGFGFVGMPGVGTPPATLSVRVQRIGADGADTLAGAVGVVGLNLLRIPGAN